MSAKDISEVPCTYLLHWLNRYLLDDKDKSYISYKHSFLQPQVTPPALTKPFSDYSTLFSNSLSMVDNKIFS
jgi:hypothetical protein